MRLDLLQVKVRDQGEFDCGQDSWWVLIEELEKTNQKPTTICPLFLVGMGEGSLPTVIRVHVQRSTFSGWSIRGTGWLAGTKRYNVTRRTKIMPGKSKRKGSLREA